MKNKGFDGNFQVAEATDSAYHISIVQGEEPN